MAAAAILADAKATEGKNKADGLLTDEQLTAEMAKPDVLVETGECFDPVTIDDVRAAKAEGADVVAQPVHAAEGIHRVGFDVRPRQIHEPVLNINGDNAP